MATLSARRPRSRGRTVANVVGVAVSVVMIFPVYWMLLTAVKPGSEILTYTPRFWTWHPSGSNFVRAVRSPHFLDALGNSVLVAFGTMLIALVLALLAAVAIARFRFYGRRAFVFVVLVVQMVPLSALIIPIYLLLNSIDAVNSLGGVVLTYLAFVLPFTIWTLRGFVAGVPAELEEAAMVDGCTRFQAFRKIVLPLVFPGLLATSIYALIQSWNEFIMAYVLLSDQNKETLPVWLVSFVTARGIDYGALMAGATMMALPVVVFFAIIQRHVASGLTAGAVKG
ncbi:carbohydrate ABC transporter permease [Actinocatenispora rupis]|uniref:Sugar ABC transporter permease n=1 Tax=Actinocatenispora rupis TaxID=519421 RepID=A0A8J3JA35_9ACTN|nr:carbohydrate ABC transporter permease [Actinocatenispora rupis]GID14476.1 sugar ABC transporter permease [Actinocatenispora rupis]